MTHILLLAMWAIAISAWYTVWYFYRCAVRGTPPDTGIVLRAIIATGLSLFIGCVMYSFLQASILNGGHILW